MRTIHGPVRGVFSALAIALSLAIAAPALAAPSHNGEPVRLWYVHEVDKGTGEVPVSYGGQIGDRLQKEIQLRGRLGFNFQLHAPYWESLPRDEPFGALYSSADGVHYSVMAQAPLLNPVELGGAEGGVSHLDEYQAYEKRAGDATVTIKLSDLLLQTIDDNNGLPAWVCANLTDCDPVRTVVRFHARAYAASAGGDFYDAGGSAWLEGHQRAWHFGAATSADSPGPLWGATDFSVDGDADDSGTGAEGAMYVSHPIRLKVPLASIHVGELFAVHVSLEAEAVDDRGGESGAQAFIQDPQHVNSGLLTTRGLKPRGKPRFKEPKVKPLAPATCPGTRPRNAGALQFSAATYTAGEGQRSAIVLVTRTGGSHGSVSASVSTRASSAQAGSDFAQTTTTVRFADRDAAPRLVEIPLREDSELEPAETFTVTLAHVKCGALGSQRSATVSIVDDDQLPPPPPPPAPTYTIGGTVDGVAGPGLVLTDRGVDLPVAADGPFTLPESVSDGASYDVEVRTQPADQLCTVDRGRGTVSGANVADIAVHCATPPVPSGLDPTFGDFGRVSTDVGGDAHGEGVVIQADGGIVTAGWHTTSTSTGSDFVLTRHTATGQLDTTYGTGGIETTDLGGNDDEAYDAALLPDGGVVAVGRTNAAGGTNTDFGVVRYLPGGTPDPGFDADGIVKTDIAGRGDQANAVAVQPDGKIVVAGSALRTPIDNDFAVVRYNADGTRDTSFGTDGIAMTDLGTLADAGRAVAIQPDGKIVVAGTADEDVALARYTADGHIDTTFGHGGTTVTDFGSEDVATGVALTPGGDIAISGYTLGPLVNRDFLLARYGNTGTLETTFGDHGAVKTDVLGRDDYAEGLVVDSSGRFVLVGRATSPTILDMALVRYLPDGTLDPSFDGDGIITADFHGRGEFGQDVALDASGRIVAAGYTANDGFTEFALLRANP
jgi:uncharacterized delta-60 repeat protein